MTRRSVFLAAVMAVASLGAMAQSNNPASTPQNNTDNSAQRTVTITGCLNSSATGVYTLSGAQGATYTLTGNTDSLQGHTGQQIEVTGQQAFGSTTSSSVSASANTSLPIVNVAKTRVLADHCQPNSGSQPGPTGSSASTTHGSSHASATATGNAKLQNVTQTEAPAVPNGQLPQTSTILPLLGLIGLGSLVAGFFARR
ncbi:MAG TPA: hypothetical protein VFA90_12445 [Terriglobales bacterium]|nr:hypothetical protein [Terriglobales bacterium]